MADSRVPPRSSNKAYPHVRRPGRGSSCFITIDYTLPDNVRVLDDEFSLRDNQLEPDGDDVERAQSAFQRFCRVPAERTCGSMLTATDPHGASVEHGHVIFQLNTIHEHGVGAPTFTSTASDRSFAKDQEIEPFVLPAATGGDVTTPGGTALPNPHFYKVAQGLPAGLSFDPLTRTVSGTPTWAGGHTVTYLADDADVGRRRRHARPGRHGASDVRDRDRGRTEPVVGSLEIASKPAHRHEQRRHARHLRGGRCHRGGGDVQRGGHHHRGQQQRQAAPGPGDGRRGPVQQPEGAPAPQRERQHAALRVHGGGRRHGCGRGVDSDAERVERQRAVPHGRRNDQRLPTTAPVPFCGSPARPSGPRATRSTRWTGAGRRRRRSRPRKWTAPR